jgi:tyrosine decarboxylase/aspartate 1-decarboxylase
VQYWKRLEPHAIRQRVFNALDQNVNYNAEEVLGVPASHLDSKVFNIHEPFLKEAPFMNTLVHNPNHIGCHTIGDSEPFFSGTQAIEREVINICGVDILNAPVDGVDGYVAAGGTEANMQAVWIYRNYFMQEHKARLEEIAILCSADSHYSMDKAADVFMLDIIRVDVEEESRKLLTDALAENLKTAKAQGKRYFIVIANMMTTMFGSVDEPKLYTDALEAEELDFRLHVDGAYGGFYFPFTGTQNQLDFRNPHVHSVTLDAHKMVQAPYGTGIFIIRKNYMHFANTRSASYVAGEDYTLSGSRSGANAVAIWMILATYGPFGWREKIFILQKRSDWICHQLSEMGISFYRHPHSNIITLKAKQVPDQIAGRFGLVPDDHHHPDWYKIVVMEHVIIEKLAHLSNALKLSVQDFSVKN